eukprot:scaffold161412_cov20-Prasinocladus_malaysianus.AAC.1
MHMLPWQARAAHEPSYIHIANRTAANDTTSCAIPSEMVISWSLTKSFSTLFGQNGHIVENYCAVIKHRYQA